MNKEIKDILTKGLIEGYVGNSKHKEIVRAGFNVTASDYQGPEGKYHDEWVNGGGQELVETGSGEKATRVYAGKLLEEEKLIGLGITHKHVIRKLIHFVHQLGDKTRLNQDAEAADGEWKYSYRIMKSVMEIPVNVGEEEIRYHNHLVFVHFHIISPYK